ncbi:phage/plasmid replication protein, II/X family [Glaesserella parasuis]|uniref:phage/plasmid replication protein, II/X family n=1 Tax=Glaesserella parasuis TaxID=738 RepID=UPI00094FFBB6|nr:phage/plasmid replication protein, II/X family [Glaesserella parasuis]MDG4923301.1 phage/plasmid replication protein, II/X family [Glaesserella parasuis]MDG6227195.1 phage/plasmid replication protein, II/X family [Glaesserella parasuis]MDG6233187.1 phage/plasmid replication protein, II/X family [Glaesserella parasuis]MDG6252883.1 phage/plasmid replication protein, II/X family [Glaesserella parasuis]MDG6255379.1 phage/plasmid replication protein, II/X family [Glaesserella parasuis]
MIDFLKISIPFKTEHIIICKDGETSFLKDALIEIARKTGVKLKSSNVTFEIDGDLDVQDLSHPYESIPSHYSSLAMKIFNGSDKMKTPPYVELKASPAKLLQGHNVFGSTNLDVCAFIMLESFIKAMPELYEMVDVAETSVDWIDVTYSAHINSESMQKQVISFLQNVQVGQTRKTKYNKEYETTAEWNSGSEHRCLKVYLKGDEVQRRLAETMSELKKTPGKKHLQNTINVLSDPKLVEFSKKCVRFEARLKQRYLDKHQIPRNLFELIEYQKSYEEQGRSLIKDLWQEAFKDLIKAVGESKMNVYNRDGIQKLLRNNYFSVTPKGNISYAKADRIFSFYKNLLNDGYIETLDSMPRNTFWRYEKDLMAIGLTKAQLQNLKAHERHNIIPLMKVVEIDFSCQRPDWYVEPTIERWGLAA